MPDDNTEKDTTEKTCFVISPIGEAGSEIRRRADQVLNHIIAPCAIFTGYPDIIRADKISDPGAITHQIIHYVINADLVIADLTGSNPNVYYELAIRHMLRKPYVQICDLQTVLPFDVKNQRTIMFDYKDLDSVEEAKNTLINYINSATKNPEKLMTPIHEGLALELLLQSEKPSDQILGELVQQMGAIMDKLNRLERQNQHRVNLIETNLFEDVFSEQNFVITKDGRLIPRDPSSPEWKNLYASNRIVLNETLKEVRNENKADKAKMKSESGN